MEVCGSLLPTVRKSSGCGEKQAHARHAMIDDERAIRDLVASWMKASEAGDVQTVLVVCDVHHL